MRTKILYLALTLLTVYSCSKTEAPNTSNEEFSSLLLPTKGEIPTKPGNYFVSLEDVQAYTHFRKLESQNNGINLSVTRIEPLGPEEDVTLCYLINYNDGWELVSADKRTPAVLAESDTGSLELEDILPPVHSWLDSFLRQIQYMRNVQELEGLLDQNEMERVADNLQFWSFVTCDRDFVEEYCPPTKGQFDPDGYWELVSIETDTVEYQVVNHLITTHWHQDAPYNSYCPFKSNSSIWRAPAGCSAVAAAQMAYYLHNKEGWISTAPLTAFCDAQVPSPGSYYMPTDNDPHMYVNDLSSNAWALMATDASYCAKLMAQIGIIMKSKYYDDYSQFSPSNLFAWYFNPRNVWCESVTLNDSNGFTTLYDNILNGFPVIASANSQTSSHSFIIDGYKNERIRLTATYTWIPTNPENANYYEDQIQINYLAPRNHKITMNWGWGNLGGLDDIWYSPEEPWYMYSSGKSIICNFSPVS